MSSGPRSNPLVDTDALRRPAAARPPGASRRSHARYTEQWRASPCTRSMELPSTAERGENSNAGHAAEAEGLKRPWEESRLLQLWIAPERISRQSSGTRGSSELTRRSRRPSGRTVNAVENMSVKASALSEDYWRSNGTKSVALVTPYTRHNPLVDTDAQGRPRLPALHSRGRRSHAR